MKDEPEVRALTVHWNLPSLFALGLMIIVASIVVLAAIMSAL